MTDPKSATPQEKLTYREAGVDIDKADELIRRIKPLAAGTRKKGILGGVGGFASLLSLQEAAGELKDPVLVSGTDGVGTKLKVAFLQNRHDTVGIDLVAMSVNDIITSGAKPLFFLDYFATGRLELEVAEAVIRGVARGCELADCTLAGGETAELPGLYADGEYDLAGFAVGVVEREAIIDGRSVAPKDLVIGVSSHGIHSNGLSLARKALIEQGDINERLPGLAGTVGEELLRPTAIYAETVAQLVERAAPKALAHITGGGIEGNLVRVLPEGTSADIDRSSIARPPLFDHIKARGGIEEAELFRTFNMGVGLCVVVSPERAEDALDAIRTADEVGTIIGEIRETREDPTVQLVG